MMCCYYPTTTIAIDDDVDFLRVISQHLGIADCISYSSPSKAISSLKNTNPFERIQPRITRSRQQSDDTNTTETYELNINLHELHEEIYSDERFYDISVLIVDYHMQEMNGIDVCKKLMNHPAKKILLTGGIDKEKIAIDAFNSGIIHRFINKSDPNFPNQLKLAVLSLKEAYFREISTKILPNISHMPLTLLHTPAYINFAKNLKDQFNSIEHYLLDTLGSSLFLDKYGMPLWLIIKHKSELDNFIDIAKDQEARYETISSLTNREMIPFFFLEEDYLQPVSHWREHLYSAYPLIGTDGYYYATIQGNVKNNLKYEHIISYATHQKIKKKANALSL